MNRLDRRTVFSLMIGLAAVIVLMIIWGWASRDKNPEKVTVLYATKTLPAWTPIDNSSVEGKPIPFNAYRRGSYYTSKSQLLGRRPVVDIQVGEILRPEMFKSRNGDITALLPPGTFAYSLALGGNKTRIPQSISVGDRVDLIAEIRSKTLGDSFIITVAQDLLVVNIERGSPRDSDASIERVTRQDNFLNNVTSRKRQPTTPVPRAVVLALTREQVQDIELTKSAGGNFTILLRSTSIEHDISQKSSRTLNEFLQSRGININAKESSVTGRAGPPKITIIRGVEAQEVAIQSTRP